MIDFENIENDYRSYNFLVDFYRQNKDKAYQTIDISFGNVDFIAANTCSIIGAIFQKLQNSFNGIRLFHINDEVKKTLQRNGFLSFLGFPRLPDYYHTTIQYMKLFPNHSRFFSEYIREELMGKSEIPGMSDRLKKKITEGIYEIFINAAMHSNTKEGIFTCGQFFKTKHKIEFTITDLGIGMRNPISQYLRTSISAVDAIEWAMQEGNSTKPNDSGGLGLAILKHFITLNKGRIQVISNNGFWELSAAGIDKRTFSSEFPGTAVNICIKTDDPMQYVLTDEIIHDEDIF
ncbi:MAG: ATP-binding protein [Candidatus Aminicenantes bacterium]|nr:ATP-binding protein [Candidatus Aminicenantes bacterium]